jgi:chromatin segregation and condensation protein Rec8/ScpA/Scc1 (kleisin family)
MITQQLIVNIMDAVEHASCSAEYIYNNLKEVEAIAKFRKDLNREIEEENKKHEAKIKDVKQRMTALQERCKHWSKTYHPDPSGNSDSYYECDICDKYM